MRRRLLPILIGRLVAHQELEVVVGEGHPHAKREDQDDDEPGRMHRPVGSESRDETQRLTRPHGSGHLRQVAAHGVMG